MDDDTEGGRNKKLYRYLKTVLLIHLLDSITIKLPMRWLFARCWRLVVVGSCSISWRRNDILKWENGNRQRRVRRIVAYFVIIINLKWKYDLVASQKCQPSAQILCGIIEFAKEYCGNK